MKIIWLFLVGFIVFFVQFYFKYDKISDSYNIKNRVINQNIVFPTQQIKPSTTTLEFVESSNTAQEKTKSTLEDIKELVQSLNF